MAPTSGRVDGMFSLAPEQVREVMRELTALLPALSHGQLLEAFATAQRLGDAIDASWTDDNAPALIAAAREQSEADPTGLLDYVLAYPRGAHRDWKQRRQQLSDLLTCLREPSP